MSSRRAFVNNKKKEQTTGGRPAKNRKKQKIKQVKKEKEEKQEKELREQLTLSSKHAWLCACYAFRMEHKDKIDAKTGELMIDDKTLLDTQVKIYHETYKKNSYKRSQTGEMFPVSIAEIAWCLKWFHPISFKQRPPKNAIVPVMRLDTGIPYPTTTFGTLMISELDPKTHTTQLPATVSACIDAKGQVKVEIIDHPLYALSHFETTVKGTEEDLAAWYAASKRPSPPHPSSEKAVATEYVQLPPGSINKPVPTEERLQAIQKEANEEELKKLESDVQTPKIARSHGMEKVLVWEELMIKQLGSKEAFDKWAAETRVSTSDEPKVKLHQSLLAGLQIIHDKEKLYTPADFRALTPQDRDELAARLKKYAEQEGKTTEQKKDLEMEIQAANEPESEFTKLTNAALTAKEAYMQLKTPEERMDVKNRDAAVFAVAAWLDYKLKNDFKSNTLRLQEWKKSVLLSRSPLTAVERGLLSFLDNMLTIKDDAGSETKKKQDDHPLLSSSPTVNDPGDVKLDGLDKRCDDCIYLDMLDCVHNNKVIPTSTEGSKPPPPETQDQKHAKDVYMFKFAPRGDLVIMKDRPPKPPNLQLQARWTAGPNGESIVEGDPGGLTYREALQASMLPDPLAKQREKDDTETSVSPAKE
jgi:hypothetical protein